MYRQIGITILCLGLSGCRNLKERPIVPPNIHAVGYSAHIPLDSTKTVTIFADKGTINPDTKRVTTYKTEATISSPHGNTFLHSELCQYLLDKNILYAPEKSSLYLPDMTVTGHKIHYEASKQLVRCRDVGVHLTNVTVYADAGKVDLAKRSALLAGRVTSTIIIEEKPKIL